MPVSDLRLAATLLVVALAAGACGTRDNPATCTSKNPECGALVCDPVRQVCVPKQDGGGRDASDGPGGAEVGGEVGGTDLPPGACLTAANCQQEGLRQCVGGRCVACASDSHCDADRPFCSRENTCITCGSAAADMPARLCPSAAPVCAGDGRCVACLGHADCAGDANAPLCSDRTCVSCQGQPAGTCASKNPKQPACAPSGACVECVTSKECGDPAAPICVDNKCVPCVADDQCADRDGPDPGLCLIAGPGKGGRCARSSDVIYVRRTAPCVEGAGAPGTADMPHCRPGDALAKVTPTRRVLLLRGQDPFPSFTIPAGWPAATGGPLLVVGQPGAAIAAGAEPVTIRAGEVVLQGLTIRDGEFSGVLVEGAATVYLHRCLLRGNKKGGLRVTGGAGFHVQNTVIDGNGSDLIGGLVAFGGAYLGTPTAPRPGVFRFNTVVNNAMAGVTCEAKDAAQVLSSVLLWMNAPSDHLNCTVVHSRVGMAPAFDATNPYHLTGGSPCKDHGDPASFPVDDFDGEPRPVGMRSDCGADEFRPD